LFLDLAPNGVSSYFLRVRELGGFACLHDL
jgi:hypothetical protein